MSNIIIKSDERKKHEKYVMQSFKADSYNSEMRDAAECIAARSREAYSALKRMEGKKYYG